MNKNQTFYDRSSYISTTFQFIDMNEKEVQEISDIVSYIYIGILLIQ